MKRLKSIARYFSKRWTNLSLSQRMWFHIFGVVCCLHLTTFFIGFAFIGGIFLAASYEAHVRNVATVTANKVKDLTRGQAENVVYYTLTQLQEIAQGEQMRPKVFNAQGLSNE